jgi:cytochrome P450
VTDRWERRIQLGAHPLAYSLVRGISRLGPVVRVPRIGVVVSDAAVAREVLTDPERFTKTGPGSPSDLWTPVLGPSVLLNMEGAAHGALRTKLSNLFTPRSATELCTRILTDPLAALRSRLLAGERVELVGTVQRLVGRVISELVGLPGERPAEMYAAGVAVTSMVRLGRRRLTRRQITSARRALGELTGPAIAAFRRGDEDTVPGRMRQHGLTEAEARGAVGAFVLTGTETLVSSVPRLVALAHDTDWLPRLASDRSRCADVVSEALRVIVPSPVMLRSVAAPGRVGRVAVRPGDRVVIATVSCARAYGGFDPDRPHPKEVRQLWFGAGPHFCLGMPLAMAEIDAVFGCLLDVARDRGGLRIVERAVARRVLIPGYARLVVRA